MGTVDNYTRVDKGYTKYSSLTLLCIFFKKSSIITNSTI